MGFCDPSIGRGRERRILEAHGPANVTKEWTLGSVRDFVSKTEVESNRGRTTALVSLWIHMAHPATNTQVHRTYSSGSGSGNQRWQ